MNTERFVMKEGHYLEATYFYDKPHLYIAAMIDTMKDRNMLETITFYVPYENLAAFVIKTTSPLSYKEYALTSDLTVIKKTDNDKYSLIFRGVDTNSKGYKVNKEIEVVFESEDAYLHYNNFMHRFLYRSMEMMLHNKNNGQ